MIDSFLKYLQFEKRVSRHTVLAYHSDLTQFREFLKINFPDELIQDADFGMIRSWLVELVENSLEPRSVNRKIASLRAFYKFLLREQIINKDPTMKIRVMKAKKKLPVFLKESEIEEILDTNSSRAAVSEFAAIRNHLIIELLYSTGIRLSELINLQVSDIDLRKLQLKVLGKRNKERIIPFPETLKDSFQAYLKIRKRDVHLADNDILLVTDKGSKCYPTLIQRMVKTYLAGTSADKKSPHVLRHTYATHLLDKGAEINAVKDLLGHSSLAATQVYTHNSMEKLKKVFDQAHPKA